MVEDVEELRRVCKSGFEIMKKDALKKGFAWVYRDKTTNKITLEYSSGKTKTVNGNDSIGKEKEQ